ncbi:hypothetical protein [Pseudomonas promysalinigenes]|jgi:hypothetical protein|uniref:Uncharacterized protein n=1 Tax=Pseudomonas promysalinigenes TaxID=485898 RepID=A0ABY6ARL8_9PSED|nr:hypothetical protein [Pseudomonas promysalinigenes]UXH41630.1 hypothetical protein N5C08_08930 [Pseudomonas promysalinigenes]
MGVTIAKKPELDINGERWVEFAPGARLLVRSAADPLYRSHLAVLNRHIGLINNQCRVGSQNFSISSLPQVEFENGDDLYFELAAMHLVKNWDGVDVEGSPGSPAPYSTELCKKLFEQMPSAYLAALQAANDIAKRVEEQAKATVEKQ